MKLAVARHCQTDWNAAGRIQGQVDTDLNDVGRRQAAALAGKVKSLGLALVVCSDLKRAAQTAEVVAAAAGVSVRRDARLRECSFGSLDGLTFAEFGLRCGLHNIPWADPLGADFTPFGGEKGADVFARQKAVLDELKVAHDAETVMVIGHGRSLRTLLVPLGCTDKGYRKQGEFILFDY